MHIGKRLWFAGAAAGTIVATTAGVAFGQNIDETVNGPSSGVVAIGTGTQNVTVTITKKGDVDNPTGPAVTATAQQGDVTIIDHGQVTGAAGGILGQTSGPNVSVTVTQGVAGGTGNAVEALDNAGGAASVTIGSGQNANHPLTITTTGKVGAGAISVTGNASIRVGDNVSISAGAPGLSGPVAVLALGVLTPSDTGGPSAVATVGKNATLTVQGNNGAAVSAQIGLSGQEGPNGTASASVTVGDGVNINVSGLSDAGVIGFVKDLTPLGLYNGSGNVSVTVGTGSINVNENGAVGVAAGSRTNVGEGAFSAGGNVSISNAADITVSGGQDGSIGIDATTNGAGSVSITSSGSVSSANGDAIDALAFSGPVTVNVTGGDLTAEGDGINAASFGGAVDVSTAKSVSIAGVFGGISAGGPGTVTVTSGGPILSTLGDGIDANGLAVALHIEGDITAGGAGVSATGGPVDISIDKGVSIAAGDAGVSASGNGAAIDISIGKAVTIAAGGAGVTATGGAIDISIGDSSDVVAGGLGVSAVAQQGDVAIIDNGRVAGAIGGILGQTSGPNVSVTVTQDVAGGTGNAVEALDNAGGAASVTVGDGQNATHPLTIATTGKVSAGAISVTGNATIQVGDNVTVNAGAPGEAGVAGVLALGVVTAADTAGPSAVATVGRNATIDVQGNGSAAVAAQIGQSGIVGPNGTASTQVTVGNGVNIHVSGFNDAGVIGFVDDLTPSHIYAGRGDVSVSVGTGTINVSETGAVGAASGALTNAGEGAFSAGGNVSLSNAADVTVSGGEDASVGLSATTAGAGSATITSSGDVASANGSAVNAATSAGPVSVSLTGGAVTGTDAAVNASSSSGAITIDVAVGSQLSGGVGVRATSLSGAISVDNAGQISGGVSLASSGPVSLKNEFGAFINGAFTGADHVTFNNAGIWLTADASDFGTPAGAASNTLNNTGLIQIGVGSGPTAAAFNDLGAFNNGSASALGLVSMLDGHVGDTLTVSGLFTGAAGHSLLGLDVQLGGPGWRADVLILQGGSAGQTLIRVNDVLHGHAALNPGGIVLVQGSSAASTFALDPTQAGYDPVTKGIDKGLFTYPLVYSGGAEVLVGEPGLPAHQLATLGAAAEDIWSAIAPGDQSEAHLALGLANGGEDASPGLYFWAQALNGGPSRLNGGQTLMGRANFASDPGPLAGAPQSGSLAGLAQQTASFSAYGMTYGFDTGYAQAVSALITGVDLAHHVDDRQAWSWGVSTGYLESQQSFTAGASIAQYQGALAAVHGAYVNTAGFHVAGDVKMTALQVSYLTAWGGGGADAPNAAIDTFGAEADAGWTRPLAAGWTLDPVASLSMQSSKLGVLSLSGVDVRFGDASSVRLGLGARLSGGGRIFGLDWKSQSSLTMWDELRGANTLDLVAAGAGQVLPDPIGGTFADAAESLSFAAPDGRASAFVSGAVRWKSDYEAAQIAMGVKLAW